MATHEILVDYRRPLTQEPDSGHNRWHPDLKPVVRCTSGDEVIIEARDGSDLQLSYESSSEDVGKMNQNTVHPLTGPVYIEDAEPGDLLAVEILDISTASFGFTAQIPGVGFLQEEFPHPHLTRWDIANGSATSPDLPGVVIPGAPFMGIIGVAPSRKMLDRIRAREEDIMLQGGHALPPEPEDAVPNQESIASTGLRTIPPRENGGNLDIKQLTAGTTLLIPTFVEGALFSAGDPHFAQGDGEVCGTAIETCGTLHARFKLHKGLAHTRNIGGLHFTQAERVPAASGPIYATTGIPVDSDGVCHPENLTLAAQNALRDMIDHLQAEYGYTRQQAYTICSVAVDLRVGEVVNLPNVVATAVLPLGIFNAR